jgi:glutamate--cysteine ligase
MTKSPVEHGAPPVRPITDWDELSEPFRVAEKPEARWRIGAETEKFGIIAGARPLSYDGPNSVAVLFEWLRDERGWEPVCEQPDGAVIALTRDRQSITLEPGAQFELSGAPLPDVHAVVSEQSVHLAELGPFAERAGVTWLSVGFHPFATLAELPWVPKRRYSVMRRYLPAQGSGALDMMQRTATTQANFDFSSEADAMRKLRVCLKWSPVIHAMTANAPFFERRRAPMKSVRGDVWLRMDPRRSGLIAPLWPERAGYRDYVDWALDAGMFLFRRGDVVIENTGQSFRSFLEQGYSGHRPTMDDWKLHLNSLFPEARLKSTLEVRCADAQSPTFAAALIALFTGLLYDELALAEAEALAEPFDVREVEALRPAMVREGVTGKLAGRKVQALAEQLCDVAARGLERRGRLDAAGKSESAYLTPLAALVRAGKAPADCLLEGLGNGDLDAKTVIDRCRVG